MKSNFKKYMPELVTKQRFNIELTLEERGTKEVTVRHLLVSVKQPSNEYATGYMICIRAKENKDFDLVYDVSSDVNYNILYTGAWLANWAYHYWAGEFGKYDIKELNIKRDDRTK